VETIIFILVLLLVGYGFGRAAELRHFKSIQLREKALQSIPAIATKIPDPTLHPRQTQLVAGNVVISVDYFKRFIAGLRNLVGGRVTSYETLLDRARREAILRMKEEAKALGATLIFNVKFETASISKGRKDQVGAVEVYAYGTAFID
jgi:uncharacterized protein YbjQ (UPF0145 family)